MAFRMSKKDARQLGIIPPQTTPSQYSPMNSLESDYAEYLEQRRMASDILGYRFEPFKLILVHGVPGKRKEMTYKPDFLIILRPEVPKLIAEREARHTLFRKCYEFEIHEVKGGYIREDSILKLKMAAELFPWFKFYLVQRERGEWKYNEY